MKGKVVAILETRTGAHLGELVEKRGGMPMLAPALNEVPDIEPQVIVDLVEGWRSKPYRMVIFQTGVGTRALFKAADDVGCADELVRLLSASIVVVRGPKPLGELNARKVRIDWKAPSPFTSETVLALIAGIDLAGAPVLVQRYGATNETLRDGLEARGALVHEIATYRWALPADVAPLKRLLEALSESRIDAVVFTSAVQIHNLYAVARSVGSEASLAGLLNRTVVASIGPVCSKALQEYGVTPTFEADPPKLGPMVAGLEAAWVPSP